MYALIVSRYFPSLIYQHFQYYSHCFRPAVASLIRLTYRVSVHDALGRRYLYRWLVKI